MNNWLKQLIIKINQPGEELTIIQDIYLNFHDPHLSLSSSNDTSNGYSNLGTLAVVTWQVFFVCVPMIVLAVRLQVLVSLWLYPIFWVDHFVHKICCHWINLLFSFYNSTWSVMFSVMQASAKDLMRINCTTKSALANQFWPSGSYNIKGIRGRKSF
jgi:hypothetical protein